MQAPDLHVAGAREAQEELRQRTDQGLRDLPRDQERGETTRHATLGHPLHQQVCESDHLSTDLLKERGAGIPSKPGQLCSIQQENMPEQI